MCNLNYTCFMFKFIQVSYMGSITVPLGTFNWPMKIMWIIMLDFFLKVQLKD